FTIAEGFAGRFFAPGADVNFIDAERRAKNVLLSAFGQPVVVRPGKFLGVPDDGGVFGWRFEKYAERIGFQLDVTLASADFVFVMCSLSDAGDKDFPDAGLAKRTHLMEAAIPIVKIANDTDALGVRSPNAKTCAGDAVDSAEM